MISALYVMVQTSGLNFKILYWLLQVQSELSRIIGAENISGAEDRLKEALKVLHGGENLTNVEVVEAMKMIQERTKRKKQQP